MASSPICRRVSRCGLTVGFSLTMTSPGTKRGWSDRRRSSSFLTVSGGVSGSRLGSRWQLNSPQARIVPMVMKRASLIASSTCSRLYFLNFLASGRAQLTPGGVVNVHAMNFLPGIIAVTVLGTLLESEANFVPGEVMVKFVSGSDAEKAVREMSQKFPLRLDDFVQVVRHLEASVRIPLTVSQVTSGNWLVLKIDSETLSRGLADRLRGYQNVAEAELLGEDKKPVGYMPPKKIAVKFVPGS